MNGLEKALMTAASLSKEEIGERFEKAFNEIKDIDYSNDNGFEVFLNLDEKTEGDVL